MSNDIKCFDTEVICLEENNEDEKALLSNAQSMVDSTETVTLTWQDVNVHVIPPSRSCCRGPDPSVQPKQVLKNVSGHIKPGTLVAVIGASGAGKTTLLNALTSRIDSDACTSSGDIRVNGVNVGTGICNISGYVRQDELFMPLMTVKEHLTFRALLRMERSVPRERRLQRVQEVLADLNLTSCEDMIVGAPAGRVTGISGGERKRLFFATELPRGQHSTGFTEMCQSLPSRSTSAESQILTNPPLLFCDEPTSGLDSYMATNIVQILSQMANKGKTVMCTIHQPSSELFAMFDNVLILADGRTAFMGKTTDALQFFNTIGSPCPVHFNPADFYISTLATIPGSETQCKTRIAEICDSYDASTFAKVIEADTREIEKFPKRTGVIFDEVLSSSSRYDATYCVQFNTVLLRAARTSLREPYLTRIRITQITVMAVMLGLIFFQLDVSQEGVMDINSALFLSIMNLSFGTVTSVLNTFIDEKLVFFREYNIGMYRVDTYYVCKLIAETPYLTVTPLIYCCISYWIIGLNPAAKAFFIYIGAVVLTSHVAASFGYLLSAVLDSVTIALAFAPMAVVPFLLFGGFFLNIGSVPIYFQWFTHVSWLKYGNEMVVANQWRDIQHIDCSLPRSTNSSTDCSRSCFFTDGDTVIEYLNMEKDNIALDAGVMVAMIVIYRLAAYIVLLIKARRSKL